MKNRIPTLEDNINESSVNTKFVKDGQTVIVEPNSQWYNKTGYIVSVNPPGPGIKGKIPVYLVSLTKGGNTKMFFETELNFKDKKEQKHDY